MKNLLILIAFGLSTFAFSKSYVVELKDISHKDQLLKVKGVNSLSAFSPFDLDETNSTVVIEATDQAYETLKSNPNILHIEKNFDVTTYEVKPGPRTISPTEDLLSNRQWGLVSQDQIIVKKNILQGNLEYTAKENVDIKWQSIISEIETKIADKKPLVAVIDMGIDLEHPDLKHAIYRNEKECDENGNVIVTERIDRDNNKLPGDCHGWNFAARSPFEQQFPNDDMGHGTHISGIIAAKRDNHLGIAGISDKIQILPIRVVGAVDQVADERRKIMMQAPSQRIANGVYYAALMGADVINLSLGWPSAMDTEFMRKAFSFAHQRGVHIVAAAGNDEGVADIFPCNYPNVICVGSMSADEKMSSFSNYGGQVDILAPGDDILSTIPTQMVPLKINIQGYEYASGTSQAAPHVSASLALLKHAYPEENFYQSRVRLYAGMKSIQEERKAMGGLLQLEDSFKSTRKYMIRPDVKGFNTITVASFHRPVKFPFFLESLGAPFEGLEVVLSSESEGVELLTKNFKFEKVNARKLKLEVVLKAKPTTSDYINLKAILKYQDYEEEFHHTVNIGKNVFAVTESIEKEFDLKGDKIPLILKDSNRIFSPLQSIKSHGLENVQNAYYLERTINEEAKKGKEYKFFLDKGKAIVKVKELFLEDSRQLTMLYAGDFFYNNKQTYLMSSIILKEGDSSGFIQYDYLDENFNLVKTFKYEASDPIFQRGIGFRPENYRFAKSCLNETCYATPVFTLFARIPDRNQNIGAFDTFDDSFKTRIFQLKIKNEAELEIHALTNNVEERKIKSQVFSLSSSVAVVTLLHQSVEQFNKGIVKALYTVGSGVFQTNVIATLDSQKLSYKKDSHNNLRLRSNPFYESSQGRDFLYSPYPHKKLYNGKKEGDSFAEFITKKQIQVMARTENGTKTLSYVEKDRSENVESFLSMFKLQETYSAFLQTTKSIVLLQEDQAYKAKVKKFSFLPGRVVEEMFAPVVLNTNGRYTPGIFTDSTLVSFPKVSIKTLTNNRLGIIGDNNYHLPGNCVALSPGKNKKGYYLKLICSQKDRGFFIKEISL
jgi:subtilisin family serine protease